MKLYRRLLENHPLANIAFLVALANRGLNGTDVADATHAWFRDTFAGKAEAGEENGRSAWLVRVVGQHVDPERVAEIPVGRGSAQAPLASVAKVSRARAKAGSLASYDSRPAVMLAITKKSRTNTLDLVARIKAFIAERNPALAGEGVQLQLLDDQTVPTRESIRIMESNALVGLLVVLASCWLFLGGRIAALVALGIPFSLAGTFAALGALGYTLNISVLLGVVIALGMLVDDAVVVVETIYYKMQRGMAAIEASLDAMREVFAPVSSAVLTTMAAFLPLMLLPGIVGKFMFVIPFIVTLALAISLIEAYWILPVHVVTASGGRPPLTKPVRVRVRGDDPLELRAAADALLNIVRAVPGTKDVVDDDVPGRPQLVLELDREALRAAGVDAGTVARLVRLAVDGEIVAVTRDRGEKLELRVRAQHRGDGRTPGHVGADIFNLLDHPLALNNGQTTTLGALVNAEAKTGKGVIKHYNLLRAITVEADLDKETTDTAAADRRIRGAWDSVAAQFPNTSIDFSGEMEDIRESLEAMKWLFLLGVGLIYLILAAQFRSYWQPLLILVTVPLAFTGVALGLLVSRIPLSLYTLYGVIALTGIAVNSAIVLIDAANERRASGMSALHAAVYAARRRVVPILITSVTTIGGLFSLASGLAGKSLLWGPVAASIVWGLAFSTVLTLFVIPLLYWMAMRRRKPVR